MCRSLIFILYIFLYIPIQAQNQNEIDSLEKKNKESRLKQIRILEELAHGLRNHKPQKAKDYINQAMILTKKENIKADQSKLQMHLGVINLRAANYNIALQCFKTALKINLALKDTIMISRAYNKIKEVYWLQNDYPKVIEYQLRLMKLLKKKKGEWNQITYLKNLGDFFEKKKDYPNAYDNYFKALDLSFKVNSINRIHNLSIRIARIYEKQYRYREAIKIYKRIIKERKQKNENYEEFKIQDNLGFCECKIGQYDSGIKNINTALKITKKKQLKLFYAQGLVYLGFCLRKKGVFIKSKNILEQAIKKAQEINAKVIYKDALEQLYELYKTKKRFFKALKYYEQYNLITDTLFKTQKTKQELEMQVLFESYKKNIDIQKRNEKIRLLQKEKIAIKKQCYIIIEILYSIHLIGCLVMSFFIVRNKRQNHTKSIFKKQAKFESERHKKVVENLQRDLDIKNQQLASKILQMEQKNDLLRKLQSELEVIGIDKLKIKTRDLKSINQLINLSFVQDNEWDTFLNIFTEIHPSFSEKIKKKYPLLNHQDLRLCALIKLGFVTKEIASIIGVNAGSISIARYRLRKKIGLKEGEKLDDAILDV
ncbi:MAG TPA: hypothetical protein DCS93_13275 [Microscillaceae bacterium]|nr:hypothetical protein [Microscillaceae bacterium]